MTNEVRVRFAPSPTGEPHVGNIRTAIFTWLFARGNGGTFIIRIEDTDQSRQVKGAVEGLLSVLRWLGLDWDEGPEVGGNYGPYFQSQRLDSYQRVVERLLEDGRAYRCFCTPERLAEMRKEQNQLKQLSGYDRRCRGLGSEERLATGERCVVRFAMPLEGVTKITDLIRGNVSFENRLIDDFVMLKSDGFPTYHLAHVIDDHAMEISHVLRAEEWLPSAPRHLQIYEALGWQPPQFAHLPIILAPDRSKLSKRHGATSVLQYRELGYLPQAMVNFLAVLGWSLDDETEIFSVPELIESFSLDRISRSGAIFDLDKLNWFNGYYIRRLTHEELADALLDYWGRNPPEEVPELPDKAYLLRIVPLVQERLKRLSDAAPLIPFFFNPGVEYDTADLVQKGMDVEGTRGALERAHAALEGLASFDASDIEGALRPLAEELGLKAGQLFGSLRVATTGLRVSPPLFQTMELLGRERSLASISAAVRRL
jgi:glutamyl-tRNA synthetase